MIKKILNMIDIYKYILTLDTAIGFRNEQMSLMQKNGQTWMNLWSSTWKIYIMQGVIELVKQEKIKEILTS